jgi:hypothetical protein
MSKKYLLILSFLLSLASPAFAQDYFSPFSQYGLGDMQSQVFARYLGMGGAGNAALDDNIYNIVNPASYAMVHSFVFEGGVSGTQYWLKSNTQKYNFNDASVNYVSLAVPSTNLKRKWGFSAGLLPFSVVGYRTQTDYPTPVYNQQTATATGGVNRFYIGTGFKLFKNFYMGANVSYLFGNTEISHKVIFPDSTDENGAEQFTRVNVSDFVFDGGVIYKIPLKKEHSIQFGLSGMQSKNLHSITSVSLNQLYTNANDFAFEDSIIRGQKVTSGSYLPMQLHGGININYSDTWHIYADVNYTQWSHLSYGKDIIGINVGGEWMPGSDVSSGRLSSYLGRVHYRLGVGYQKGFSSDQMVVPTDKHVSVGFGLPTSKYFPNESNGSFIDLALQYGQMGDLKVSGFRRDYLMLTLGIHLFEPDWFQRRKIE